jgi:hypothetical protein
LAISALRSLLFSNPIADEWSSGARISGLRQSKEKKHELVKKEQGRTAPEIGHQSATGFKKSPVEGIESQVQR